MAVTCSILAIRRLVSRIFRTSCLLQLIRSLPPGLSFQTTGKNRNHLCGTPNEIIELFGLFWVKAEAVQNCPRGNGNCPGYWRYVDHTGPNPPGDPNPNPHSVICFRGANQQVDFFQVLHYALNAALNQTNRCGGTGDQGRSFGIGAS